MKGREWSIRDLDILRREFPVRKTSEVAKMLGRSRNAVSVKAGILGLKKKTTGIVWTPQMLKLLTDFFPIMFNKALARWIGVSVRSLIRKARELGLEKKPGFLESRRDDIIDLAREGLRRTTKKGGRFQKGVHNNPSGEFKPGRKDTPQVLAKRSAAIKRSWIYRKRREEMRAYGIGKC